MPLPPIRNRKALAFFFALIPLIGYGWGLLDAGSGWLGAEPVEAAIRGLGLWALRFLWLTLLITPLARLYGWRWLYALRRMLGLYAFFYACAHMSLYLVFDQSLELTAVIHDIVKRPFITIGISAFILLLPLATTSTNAMMRRLGGLRWRRLHRLIYVIAFLAVIHFFWMVKIDTREPLLYGAELAVLLGLRLWWSVQAKVNHRQFALRD